MRGLVAIMIEEETGPMGKLVARSLERFGESPRIDIGSLTFPEDQVVGEWFPEDPDGCRSAGRLRPSRFILQYQTLTDTTNGCGLGALKNESDPS